jgi:hypothetical protein
MYKLSDCYVPGTGVGTEGKCPGSLRKERKGVQEAKIK